jgi:hypothetical protein
MKIRIVFDELGEDFMDVLTGIGPMNNIIDSWEHPQAFLKIAAQLLPQINSNTKIREIYKNNGYTWIPIKAEDVRINMIYDDDKEEFEYTGEFVSNYGSNHDGLIDFKFDMFNPRKPIWDITSDYI